MKKISLLSRLIVLFVAMILSFSAVYTFNPSKSVFAEETQKTITVFSWEDYIDLGYDGYAEDDASEYMLETYGADALNTSILDIFEEQTGIKVNYVTFATNEEMYNELLKDPTACDLICPSEYMILKMKEEGLIKPFACPENYDLYGSKYIKDTFAQLGLADEDMTYAVGFMWGTMGLIYDASKFSDQDLSSWEYLFNDEFKGRFTIKDSLRDSYILAIGIACKDELNGLKDKLENDPTYTEEDYKQDIFEIFNRTDSETISKVEEVLDAIKYNLYAFEVDGGKNDLLSGKIDVNFAWSGDAVFSMDEGDKVGKYLRYVVPEEGSNVWFDGYVMTKDANVELATEFLNFLCRPDIAVRNMDYIGYTSCIAGNDQSTEVFDYVKGNCEDEGGDITVDLGYFFGEGDYNVSVFDGEDGSYRYLYAQYADEQTILRCAVMDNFSDDVLSEVNDMWSKVKLISISWLGIGLITGSIVLLIALVMVYMNKDSKIFKRKEKDRKIKPGFKEVKRENI